MAAPASLQRLVRRELLTRLKAHAPLTALVPASSIAPEGSPSWPFILVDEPRTRRLRMACVRGAAVSFDVHVFAGPRMSAGAIVETGRDHASRIAAEVENALADNRVTLEGGAVALIQFSDTQMLKDEEPDALHWFAQLNARVLSA